MLGPALRTFFTYFKILSFVEFIGVTLVQKTNTGFKCTTQQDICTPHHAPIAPRKVSFLPQFPLPLPCSTYSHPSFPPAITTLLSMYVCIHTHTHTHTQFYIYVYIVFGLIPSPSFIQPPNTPPLWDMCQSVPCVHTPVSILSVRLLCSLDSTYK